METSKTYLSPLELCSLESAALHHPNHTVFLLLVSHQLDSQARVSQLTRSLGNIKVRSRTDYSSRTSELQD